MIIKPLATESAVTDAAITAARVVRLVNSHASNKSTIAIGVRYFYNLGQNILRPIMITMKNLQLLSI